MSIKVCIWVVILSSVSMFLSACSYYNNLLMRPDVVEYDNYVVATKAGYKIVTPSCPQPFNAEGDLELAHNWGCSTTRNLGLMISDARDLLPQSSRLTFGTQELAGGAQRVESNHPSKLTDDNILGNDELLYGGYW